MLNNSSIPLWEEHFLWEVRVSCSTNSSMPLWEEHFLWEVRVSCGTNSSMPLWEEHFLWEVRVSCGTNSSMPLWVEHFLWHINALRSFPVRGQGQLSYQQLHALVSGFFPVRGQGQLSYQQLHALVSGSFPVRGQGQLSYQQLHALVSGSFPVTSQGHLWYKQVYAIVKKPFLWEVKVRYGINSYIPLYEEEPFLWEVKVSRVLTMFWSEHVVHKCGRIEGGVAWHDARWTYWADSKLYMVLIVVRTDQMSSWPVDYWVWKVIHHTWLHTQTNNQPAFTPFGITSLCNGCCINYLTAYNISLCIISYCIWYLAIYNMLLQRIYMYYCIHFLCILSLHSMY